MEASKVGRVKEGRYEISITVGPCSEDDVDALSWRLAEVVKAYGGAVSTRLCEFTTRGGEMSAAEVLIPVMVRGGRVHAPSGYRVFDRYATFAEAAEVVQSLRRDPDVAWAYIPDEYAHLAAGCPPPESSR